MKIKFIVIGKSTGDWLIKGIDEYKNRLMHYTNFEIIELPEIKNKSNLPIEKLQEMEAIEIRKVINKEGFNIALDENGKSYSSVQFSEYIDKKINSGIKQLNFIVGGAFGFSNHFLTDKDDKISLSAMTFSHQMVRLIFIEQLYRAFTISKNEKYHHK